VLEHEIPLSLHLMLASAGGPQPRDGLRLALRQRSSYSTVAVPFGAIVSSFVTVRGSS
jgi:hypothetical protein